MTSKVTKGHLKISNYLSLRYIFCLTPNLFKTFKNVKIKKTQFFL